MILVLAEKAKAGRRIAEILSGGRFRTIKLKKHVYYTFNLNGKEVVVFPLRGHVIDVDFPKEFSRWSLRSLKALTRAPIVRKVSAWDVVSTLKQLAPRVEEVIIATDADREGEAIGWEVVEYIFRGKPVRRAWFSALTPREIRKAFSNLIPPKVKLAEAAFARRDVDLLWGAVLTRALSLTSGRRGKSFLSVGRVQTPTLALVVEREREIRNFKPQTYYTLKGTFCEREPFVAVHPRKVFDKREVEELLGKVKSSTHGRVTSFRKEVKKVYRPVPLDTTTFLSEANKILGIPPKEALDIAEDLYTSGLISYPRTDNQTYPPDLPFSSILSKLRRIPQYRPFVEKITPPYSPSRGKKTEDHPPIHPVDVPSSPLPEKHAKVYDLIVRRFLATLMEDGLVEVKKARIDVAGVPFEGEGRRVVKKGWMEVYPVRVDEKPLPDLEEGETVRVLGVKLEKGKTKPPSRYSPGELVKKMESLGLGTKATRAEIVAKLYRRGYITGRKRVRPTPLGELVYDLLKEFAPAIVTPELTSRLEQHMEEIAQGRKGRAEVVEESRNILESLADLFIREKDNIRRRVSDGNVAG